MSDNKVVFEESQNSITNSRRNNFSSNFTSTFLGNLLEKLGVPPKQKNMVLILIAIFCLAVTFFIIFTNGGREGNYEPCQDTEQAKILPREEFLMLPECESI